MREGGLDAPVLAPADVAGVAPMGLADRPAQPLGGLGGGDEVDVVRHQAIGPDLDAAALAPLCHQVQIGAVVGVAEEGLLPTVAPLGDLVRATRCDHASQSRHAGDSRPLRDRNP